MTDVKEAPKAKTGNGHSEAKAVVPKASVEMHKAEPAPFEFMRDFAREMERVFEDFGLETGWHLPRWVARGRRMLRHSAGSFPAPWSPRIEIAERDGRFMVRAELPGISKDDVKVEIVDQMLTIEGHRKEEKKEERAGYAYSECRYGSFHRSVPLPEGADPAKAAAEFKNGVLEVSMPAVNPPSQKAQRLEVREVK